MMKSKIGVWIDGKKADIITLNDQDSQLKTVYSEIETHERFPGESKQFGRFGDQYLNSEKSKSYRLQTQMSRFLTKVSAEIKSADSVVLFGPANTKNLLKKVLESNDKMQQKSADVISTGSLTKNQKVAWVKHYFAT